MQRSKITNRGIKMLNHHPKTKLPNFTKTLLSTMIGLASIGVYAAETPSEKKTAKKKDIEVISVTGIRESYLSSINTKRNSANIVDSISLKDIGALPDNSVGETLERITGVSAGRHKGNADEVSIRGLGPLLGFATLNGRAIASGSGNRAVSFAQFPSELVNGVTVYKSQSANIMEGGVSGTIDLGTIRPVDYGKQKFQAEVKGSYNDYQAKMHDDDGLDFKTSFSYVNSYDLADGKIGFAIGYAGGQASRPEEAYQTSSTFRPCNSDANSPTDTDIDKNGNRSNCTFDDANAAAGGGKAVDGDYYLIPNSQMYRQLDSIDESDAMIAAIQWQPTETIDINLDGQISERYWDENRHDLTFDDGRRGISNAVTNDKHVLQSYSGESYIGSAGEFRERNEEYKGAGLNIKWQVTEDLAITADAAYSGSERWQNVTRARFRSQRHFFDWERRDGHDFPTITKVYTDRANPDTSAIDWTESVKDMSFFDYDSEVRKERFVVNDRIRSAKLDVEYFLDNDIFTTLRSGVSFSSRSHQNFANDSIRVRTGQAEYDAVGAAGGNSKAKNAARDLARAEGLANATDQCLGTWPQKDLGDDSNTPVNEWAFNNVNCSYEVLLDGEVLEPNLAPPSEGDIDLLEEITAIYAMSDFKADIGNMYLSGNVGVRYVQTDIASVGISQAYETIVNDEGFITLEEKQGILEKQHFNNRFNSILPSINMTLEVQDDLELRFAAYKAVSRPDMWFYGAGRNVRIDNGEEISTVQEALRSVTAKGNPDLELLESNNFEFGVNWYFAEESMLSVALYNKTFSARMGASTKDENVIVDGTAYPVTVLGSPTIFDNDESSINGLEVTLNHQFSSLPAPFDGLGLAGSYNYADSDYQSPEEGSEIVKAEGVAESITPANFSGLSPHVGNVQLYWEGSGISVRASYKYRSEYLKAWGSSLAQNNRFVDPQKSLDLSVGYKISKNFSVKAQMLNLTNEPSGQSRVVPGAYAVMERSGPKAFFSIKYRM